MAEDDQAKEEKKGKLTVEPVGTHIVDPDGPTHPISVEGQAPNPGDHVVIETSWSDEKQHAEAGPDGHYGGTIQQPPDTPGVHTISVSSSEATTSTTFPAKLVKKQRP